MIAANPDVSNWNVSSGTFFRAMFQGYGMIADPDVSKWNVSNGIAFNEMFRFNPVANPDTSKWNVTSAARYMDGMFYQALSANPDVSNWDVETKQWVVTKGVYGITVGSSSEDPAALVGHATIN